jgi:16S rRNA (uracil1498-N3)-methyltransferase
MSLSAGQTAELPEDRGHYALRVLRLRLDEQLIVFNGEGGEYLARLQQIGKKTASILLERYLPAERESPLRLLLGQAISKPEHMDYAVQKAVELGASEIAPLLCQRSPSLPDWDKRWLHWHKIILSACEQCGRNRPPRLHPAQPLHEWLAAAQPECRAILDPQAQIRLLDLEGGNAISLLIGPEGGFAPEELQAANQAGWQGVSLGPRILRTETATAATLAICQARWGDC